MGLTRDQLRAARALLHLQQDVLADMARVGVATIRRFEGGRDIGHLHVEALRRAVVEAGAVLVDADTEVGLAGGMTGVLLQPDESLPPETRARISNGRAATRNALGEVSGAPGDDGSRGGVDQAVLKPAPVSEARRGRPRGATRRARPSGTTPG